MASIVELRLNRTPVAYIRLPVRYDAWGDPYVKTTIWDELFRGGMEFMGFHALSRDGTSGPGVSWKYVLGPNVLFRDNRESRGWKP